MTDIIASHLGGPRATAQCVITDGTACVGGNSVSFAKGFRAVNAVEIDETRFVMLSRNVGVLGLGHKVCCFVLLFFCAVFSLFLYSDGLPNPVFHVLCLKHVHSGPSHCHR